MNSQKFAGFFATIVLILAILTVALFPGTGSAVSQAQDDDTATPTPAIATATATLPPASGNPAGRIDGFNIYFTSDNGEAGILDRSRDGATRFASLLRSLGANVVTINWEAGIPAQADLVVIAGPSEGFSLTQATRLWAYLENGGAALILAEPSVGGFDALNINSGLFQVTWADIGFRTQNNVVVALDGEGEDATAISAFDASNINRDHPVSDGVGSVFLDRARSIEIDIDPSVVEFELTPLVSTTTDFYGEVSYSTFLSEGLIEFNIGTDFTFTEFPVAIAYENMSTASKIILIGDRNIITNTGGLRTSPPESGAFLYPGNVQFLLNAVTWMLNTENIALQFTPPGPTATPTTTPSPTPTFTPTFTPTPEITGTVEATAAN